MRWQRLSRLLILLLVVVSTFSTGFLVYLTSINQNLSECPYLMESRCAKSDTQLDLTPPPPYSVVDRDSILIGRSRNQLTNRSRHKPTNLHFSSMLTRLAYSQFPSLFSQKSAASSKNTSLSFFVRNSTSALPSLSESSVNSSSKLTSEPVKPTPHFADRPKNTFRIGPPPPTASPPENISAILNSIPDVDFVDVQQQHPSAAASPELDPFDFTDQSLHTELAFSLRSCPQLSALDLSSFPQQRFQRVGPGTNPRGPLLLHSAFSDHRAEFVVRVIGIAEHGGLRGSSTCLLFYGSLHVNASARSRVLRIDEVERSDARFEELPENKGKR